MKRTLVIAAVTMLVLVCVAQVVADVAKPKPSPEPKIVFHSGLTVVADPNIYEARLQISPETLKSISEGAANTAANQQTPASIAHSSTRTIIAGLFLFLSISFAGVWLVRSSQSKGQKAISAVLLVAAVLGAASIITQANAGPPGYVRWANLPQALAAGRPTSGGVDIEIAEGRNRITLLVPLKKTKQPGEDE
jgi:hypothetical protein